MKWKKGRERKNEELMSDTKETAWSYKNKKEWKERMNEWII